MKITTDVIERSKRNLARLPQALGLSRHNDSEHKDRLTKAEVRPLQEQIAACVAQRGGQVSASMQAAHLAEQYRLWSPAEQRQFLEMLLDDFDIDEDQVRDALMAAESVTGEELRLACQALRKALVPARAELLRQWTLLPDGVKFLVDLRRDILQLMHEEPRFQPLSTDLKQLLGSLFNVGILQLQTIDWESPAALLEKLIEYEAVHTIKSWDDLKKRLDVDRRCFAFFHPNMPHEPLIIIEVALCHGMPESVEPLLDTQSPALDAREADTAVFFSISNTQQGLVGIPFGGFLIKQVVDRLHHELPSLRRFVTLSPVPGFRHWVEGEEGVAALNELDPKKLKAAAPGLTSPDDFAEYLVGFDWNHPETIDEEFRQLMRGLCARYLMEARRGPGVTALDPVTHFHLNNGARIEEIHWGANFSERCMRESCGLMVTYHYRLDRIEKHHEDYLHEGHVYASSHVRALRAKFSPAKAAASPKD